jgi:hypothetical protein
VAFEPAVFTGENYHTRLERKVLSANAQLSWLLNARWSCGMLAKRAIAWLRSRLQQSSLWLVQNS